jgi:hypothetical protein
MKQPPHPRIGLEKSASVPGSQDRVGEGQSDPAAFLGTYPAVPRFSISIPQRAAGGPRSVIGCALSL